VLFIGTQFSILYTFMYSPAEAAGTVGKFSGSTAISTEVAGGTGERSAVCVYVCVCVCVCVCVSFNSFAPALRTVPQCIL
jgi:hypothetical protein